MTHAGGCVNFITCPSETRYSEQIEAAPLMRFDGVMNPQAEALKRRTFKFAIQIVYFCRELRKNWEGDELADQLFRAGTRVGANYRSACRGRSHDDFVAKLGHAVEEADETVCWLELIATAKTVESPKLQPLLIEANELWAILNQSQMTARANQAKRRGTKSPIPNSQSTNEIRRFVDS